MMTSSSMQGRLSKCCREQPWFCVQVAECLLGAMALWPQLQQQQ
jgi:hypothetical protein